MSGPITGAARTENTNQVVPNSHDMAALDAGPVQVFASFDG